MVAALRKNLMKIFPDLVWLARGRGAFAFGAWAQIASGRVLAGF